MATKSLVLKNDIATKVIHVPSDWAMFTPINNRVMKAAAKTLVECAISKEKARDRLPCFNAYKARYKNIEDSSTTKEAGDTAVFEKVVDFVLTLSVEVGIDPRKVAGIIYGRNEPVKGVFPCQDQESKEKYWWDCNPEPTARL